MKKMLALTLILVCLLLVMAGCGCEHELQSSIIKEPVEGASGIIEKTCTLCGELVATEEFTLSATHDGTNYTLTVEEYNNRLNNILSGVRPGLSCRIENSKSGNPTIYVFWQEEGFLTAIIPNTLSEEPVADSNAYPGKFQNLMQLNTTHQTNDDPPIPVFDLQLDVLQAMIMACDPQIAGADARQIVTNFLESGEIYASENHGSLEYYFFLSTMGQPLLNLTLTPVK